MWCAALTQIKRESLYNYWQTLKFIRGYYNHLINHSAGFKTYSL